jgi:hypothetical protein
MPCTYQCTAAKGHVFTSPIIDGLPSILLNGATFSSKRGRLGGWGALENYMNRALKIGIANLLGKALAISSLPSSPDD